ncbi:GyrI-like domain-containing protein [Tellurirhabdus rosea]|uniref:GyrI-like domain-containing protein n=1 Tax=Tellurirhabdus rosea TaxID=2674997 RepID=UPI00224FCF9A|nr:GyrI-like domain-containing protein [Tellurirhabdus rosea]
MPLQTPRFETLPPTGMVGIRIRTTLADNQTSVLWRQFMPRRNEIGNPVGTDLYSVEVYDADLDFARFTPETPFEKWAAVRVTDAPQVPEGMETFTIPEGLYAVFVHKGPWRTFPQTFGYIFGTWLPASDYTLDNRPHFEIMQEGYDPNREDSEEEIWIPVRPKIG